MANPRVFVSSTYYDLHHVRDDIASFLQTLGYEPVMHDRGGIAYSQTESLEDSCYKEVSDCEILICIIGNKFGTKSASGDYSITMEELKRAIRLRKKIYIFIAQEVLSENLTYIKNKDNNFIPAHVDDVKIHQFIAELKNTICTHPILPFGSVAEIITQLKQQFAGLFQLLLSREASLTEEKTYIDLQNTADKIKALISEFGNEEKSFFSKFKGTMLANNPVVSRILGLLQITSYSVVLDNLNSLSTFLKDIGFQVSEEGFPFNVELTAKRTVDNYIQTLKVLDVFEEDGSLKDIKDKRYLEEKISLVSEYCNPSDEDFPF